LNNFINFHLTLHIWHLMRNYLKFRGEKTFFWSSTLMKEKIVFPGIEKSFKWWKLLYVTFVKKATTQYIYCKSESIHHIFFMYDKKASTFFLLSCFLRCWSDWLTVERRKQLLACWTNSTSLQHFLFHSHLSFEFGYKSLLKLHKIGWKKGNKQFIFIIM